MALLKDSSWALAIPIGSDSCRTSEPLSCLQAPLAVQVPAPRSSSGLGWCTPGCLGECSMQPTYHQAAQHALGSVPYWFQTQIKVECCEPSADAAGTFCLSQRGPLGGCQVRAHCPRSHVQSVPQGSGGKWVRAETHVVLHNMQCWLVSTMSLPAHLYPNQGQCCRRPRGLG